MNKQIRALWVVVLIGLAPLRAGAAETTIHVDARLAGKPLSNYLTGACIEDVNHEIYGGIYSQMIFGESFQEPATREPVAGFVAVDGQWSAEKDEVIGGAGPGPKLLSTRPPIGDGEVGAEVFFADAAEGNAGLIVDVNRAGPGADNFDGYEVSIDIARKMATLGRHHHNWKLLKEVPCNVEAGRWISLSVNIVGHSLRIGIDGKSVLEFDDHEDPLPPGAIGLRDWRRPARYRRLWMKSGAVRTDLPLVATQKDGHAVSAMWRPVIRRSANLEAAIIDEHPFTGAQSQRLTFAGGEGEVGIENQGLNRQGMAFIAGKPYEGYLWVRATKPTEVFAAMESRDGMTRYAEAPLHVEGNQWHRLNFTLTPTAADSAGRFSICLRSPGSVDIGHAFLEPGAWGRFHDLPVRRDVAEGLVHQGVTVLRYGGSMVNASEYRWKKMIGPRDRRPPYKGTWYPYSSNGWGIIDFLELCEKAGFLAIPDFNLDETAQDMADFVQYVNGPADSEWGRHRAADGHPQPFNLTHLELGNEERVDETYAQKFEALARAIWSIDPRMTLVVGDFAYNSPINDPLHVTGADSHITSLQAHQRILKLARAAGREVWFDVHVWTDGPKPSPSLSALPSYIDALEKLVHGAKHKVVVFELNAENPRQRRALANAWAITSLMRDGRLPVVTSANGLQVDGQNDNGWDQGLLFLNPANTWLQPPGYVTRMMSRAFQPTVLNTQVTDSYDTLMAAATRSDDGKSLNLRIVNLSAKPQPVQIRLDGFVPARPMAEAEVLAGPLESMNSASNPRQIVPQQIPWSHAMKDGVATYTVPATSFTLLHFQ